ncbi:EBNA-1 nuclear protein [Massilia sp. Root351]|jgi:uncharacterized NAD-dependent epimerase/dehydratase family protein|uniref:DUF1611 domain-containing protein n=1 Tax=Massilia sp. Root351 TaxID=1736522 RepID=UPI00070B9325|nr:DUF1611 domain-containing protein [Massilia sp. Root351]KQV90212.1 EBNA-1 nuclear protein [Massilia sp. Root351]
MLLLRKPYLLFLGDATSPVTAKTALGVAEWCPADVVGELRFAGATVTTGKPALSVAQAVAAGAGSLLIGIAPAGGQLPPHWLPTLIEAAAAGLDIVSGLHTRLSGIPELVAAAAAAGVQLHDVRHGDWPRVTGTGRKRPGRRLLTVGTDCALGKKYTALALARSLQARGVAATFRATGQTGIMISGGGVAIDAVVADFIAGVAEQLSPDNHAGHWDVIEGQGSLFHPAYAGVSLGLLHGSQPDALVLCHDPSRTHLDALPGYQTPRLENAIEMYLQAGRLTNPAVRCIGISVNSSSLGEAAWRAYRDRIEAELGLPVVDPIRGGVEALAAAITHQQETCHDN